ncbi:MAG TPA: HD domain-containing phosphohydrolase [Solirubrobacteraceae bacterium]|nr:HD domain-containing phosphohydrolase [Solirubrobacteraceae bacterium]
MPIVASKSRVLRAALLAAALLVVVVAAHEVFGSREDALAALCEKWVYSAAEFAAVAVCAARAFARPERRVFWSLVSGALACWTLGDLTWTVWLDGLAKPPWPSLADVFYTLGYVSLYAALVGEIVKHYRQEARALLLDGAVVGLTLAALGAALVGSSLDGASGPGAGVSLTYVVFDLLLLVILAIGWALAAWRPGRSWQLLSLAIVALTAADVLYLTSEAWSNDTLRPLLHVVWPAAMGLVALAAWQPTARPAHSSRDYAETVLVPMVFGLASLGLLVTATQVSVPLAAVIIAGVAVALAIVRATDTHLRNLRMLARHRRAATTDALTGLGNRRALGEDLQAVLDRGEDAATLAFYDLNGFKLYNDTFGHAAGDQLLRRLGRALHESVERRGRAYRLGGDEFCVLLGGRYAPFSEVIGGTRAALAARGSGFDISTACGVIVVPDEAGSVGAALTLADARMYEDKGPGSRTGPRQIQSVLMRMLSEREPTLGDHVFDVGELAVTIGSSLGMEGEELDELGRAAELHDIGKLAIPDAILRKPGPLNDSEWRFMRQHTLIGERVLNVVPAMVRVARIVRSSHEHWDGSGYPDGLAGSEIPLGARIVAVCDAYDAITAERTYDTARSPAEALDELRAGAGSQFDPEIVHAFCTHVSSRTGAAPQDRAHAL